MDQFTRWSGIIHAALYKHTSQIKLGHVHQLLAACLGHQSYASLRVRDLDTLNKRPSYVLFDVDAGLDRALDIGLPLSEATWKTAVMLLRPSGITSFWLTTISGMHSAAELTFEDGFDSRILAIKTSLGFPNGQRATSSHSHTAEDQLPDILKFDVRGEVQAYTDEALMATPVLSVVEFVKVGVRMYGEGTIADAKQCGEPRILNPDEEEEPLVEVYGDID
ncbi:hypothetical protein GTP38_05070 [Duganella sp. FT94W]|uniref:Uncharacterized protein n=1 Tax=Duganella lactea TaxID=2692173 RepID=A0ABW9V1X0_9BURK|nr:hypothetical protein [Duganella lactea]MYM33709.1 hypothetical protein [Duganella lactea]